MIRRLAHLCLITNDLEKLVAFYRDRLGLRVAFTFANTDGATYGVYLACGDTTFIEIFDQVLAAKQWGGDTQPLHAGNRFGHLCLEVAGIAELRQTLVARGVEVGEIRTGFDRSRQMWTEDPDGNRIELMEYNHHSQQLQPPGGTVGSV
jgi:catechol 2,3-dioxygenase-like lactoylglutathione lyase family enzyme